MSHDMLQGIAIGMFAALILHELGALFRRNYKIVKREKASDE